MKELRALVTLLSKQKTKNIEIIGQDEKPESLIHRLYHSISNNEISTEEEAIALLYQTNNKQAYNKLKNRLKQRLINTLFFIDVNKPSFTDYRKALHGVGKNWAAVILLLDRSARHTAIGIAETTLKTALKYDLTEFALLLARQITKHYAYLHPNRKKYLYYKKHVEELKKVFDAEMLVEDYYNIMSREFNLSKSSKKKTHFEQLKLYCQELKELQKEIKSYRFNADTFQLLTYEKLLEKDYRGVIELSHQAKDFFESKPFKDLLGQILFNYDLIRSYLILHEFTNAEKYLDENISLIKTFNFHWFRCRNFKFILLTNTKRYQELNSLMLDVLESKALTKFPAFHESWLIKEAYINFLILVGRINPSRNKKLRAFSVNRFLNEVPIFTKDKRGLNVSILIAQLLFFILNKKENEIIDRLDSLNQYCHRYLKKDDTLRSNCFIKMLMKLPEANYNPIRVQRYVDKYYKVLSSTPAEISEQSSEVEIIPYEDLWEMVLGVLEKRSGGRKRIR